MEKEPTEMQKKHTVVEQQGLSYEQVMTALEDSGSVKELVSYRYLVDLSQQVAEQGGWSFLIGGSVRDELYGASPKDFDLEIYGLTPTQLRDIITSSTGKADEVGKQFEVMKVTPPGGETIDIALPRTESKTGRGHGGFVTTPEPGLAPKLAANRRDFTMNALLKDPLSGKIYDYFGGIADIKAKRLNIIDQKTFVEDPLRALRAMQFVARFELEATDLTKQAIRAVLDELPLLSRERIGEEWQKLLTKSTAPSRGLTLGLETGVLGVLHPELVALKETPQEPEWHPEGDVWIHTLMVIDQAAAIARQEQLTAADRLVLMVAALTHDLAKPATTELIDGRIRSRGHEAAGGPLAVAFCQKLALDNRTTKQVEQLVINHLVPLHFHRQAEQGKSVSPGAYRKLARRLAPATIEQLALLVKADHLGRGPFPLPLDDQLIADFIAGAKQAEVFSEVAPPLISGKSLVALGFKPGREFGQIQKLAEELYAQGLTVEEITERITTSSSAAQAARRLQQP